MLTEQVITNFTKIPLIPQRHRRKTMAKKLEGKIALITGGSLGIGLASLDGGDVFLASDEARWITGHTVAVDGGSKL
jgi:hypothetical protein